MVSKKKFIGIIGLILLALIIVVGIVFSVNVRDATQPAIDAMESSEEVKVSEGDWIEFLPTSSNVTIGLIYYPGGAVDAHSYAVYAHMLATHGYLVVIQPMPLNLAFLDSDAALEIIDHYDSITTWVIAGHSLGGVAAASFVNGHSDKIENLLLISSQPSGDMSTLAINVLSLYGSEDSARDNVEENKDLLPSSTQYVMIDGANHAQMGYYGEQGGDGVATITPELQHEFVVNATVTFIQSV